MSVYLGTQLLSGVATNTISNAHDLFDFKWVDHELTDQSWLKADTFSWQDGTVYADAYNHLENDYTNGTAASETIGSYTINYILAPDGHKIVMANNESTVADIYAESGVAWYYVLDRVNDRFKLPRTKYGFEGFRDAVGKYIPESLPNITGSFNGSAKTNSSPATGAFSWTNTPCGAGFANLQAQESVVNFNATNSSSTYQDNAPVQERATQMYLYFYVGQFSQSATEQTAGITTSQLNTKLDLDLGNLDSDGKKVLDGQWVNMTGSSVASEVSANGSTDLEFNVSSILPNDGYDYEVILSCIATTGSTSGDYVPVYVYSDYFSGVGRYICACRPRTRSSLSVFGGGSIIIPVGAQRKIYLIRSTNYNGKVSIDIRGRRRIGTNS